MKNEPRGCIQVHTVYLWKNIKPLKTCYQLTKEAEILGYSFLFHFFVAISSMEILDKLNNLLIFLGVCRLWAIFGIFLVPKPDC